MPPGFGYDLTVSSSDDALENRVTVLEREFARFREQAALTMSDAAAARMLAAGADHDVSEVRAELRAHTQALNALRETQLELQETQLELRETQLEQGQRMSQGFSMLNTGMAQITALLTGMTGPEPDLVLAQISARRRVASWSIPSVTV